MTRSTLTRVVLNGASLLVIGFGARSLAASPQTQLRPYCFDQADCQATCERLYPGFDGVADCSSGHTCYCYFAPRAAQPGK